jgi:hypothetical protein
MTESCERMRSQYCAVLWCGLFASAACDPGTVAGGSVDAGTVGPGVGGTAGLPGALATGGEATEWVLPPEVIPDGPRCRWSEDATFGHMALPAGYGWLTAISPVWGRSDEDIYVAVKLYGTSTGDALGIAHGDGQGWAVELLPSTCASVAAISGAEAGTPWLLCGSSRAYALGGGVPGPEILRKDAALGEWTASPLDYPRAFDLEVLGSDDALVAVTPTTETDYGFVEGVVARWSGGEWVPMPMPQTGVTYAVTSLSTAGGQNVSAIGGSISSPMVVPEGWEETRDTLLSFDGTEWSALLIPSAQEGAYTVWPIPEGDSGASWNSSGILAVAGSVSGGIYVLADSFDTRGLARLFRVSADLSVWTPLSDIGSTWEALHLVSNGEGTAAVVSTGSRGSYSEIVFAYPDDIVAPTRCIAEWGHIDASVLIMMDPTTAAWSAPGSNLAHVWVLYPEPADEVVETAARHYLVEVP